MTATQIPLHALAIDALEEADGDWKAASLLMEARVREDQDLYNLVTARYVALACWNAVRTAARQQRAAFWVKPLDDETETVNTGALDTATVTVMATKNLLDYPLAGGLRLGDAPKDDVGYNAHLYETQGKTLLIRARWLRLIERHMEDAATVSEALDNDALALLMEQAKADNE